MIDAFLATHGWSNAQRTPIAGDASARRYHRLSRGGQTAVLMEDPDGSLPAFIAIAEYLSAQDLSAPAIIAVDHDAGLLLLEDLGDALFARLLEDDPTLENRLYSGAIDVLTTLHDAPPLPLTRFDATEMANIAILIADWYPPQPLDPETRAGLHDTLLTAFRPLEATPPVVALRDYHAENLIWLPDRPGPARVGLLDFQDAVLAHPAYDLVSVLHDARRDVGAKTQAAMLARYCTARGLDIIQFTADAALMSLQRNLRILGIFGRLTRRDGKPRYRDFVSRVWGHVIGSLETMENAALTREIISHFPAPTPEFLIQMEPPCPTP